MKGFLGKTVKCAIVSFLISLIIYCFSAALSTGNFTRTIWPEAKHLVSYHLLQISTPATAASIPIDKVRPTSSSFWPVESKDNGNCLFLILWGLCFLCPMLISGYVYMFKVLNYRKRDRQIDYAD